LIERSGSVSYQLCLWHFAALLDYLVGLQKGEYCSFDKKYSEIKVKLTLQLSQDSIINPAVLEGGGSVAARLEQWQRYNISHSHMEACSQLGAEPIAATVRGAADHAYSRICLFSELGFGPVVSAAETLPHLFSPVSWHVISCCTQLGMAVCVTADPRAWCVACSQPWYFKNCWDFTPNNLKCQKT